MDKEHYEEMRTNAEKLMNESRIQNENIYLFGHCNATEELADLFIENGYRIKAILDNNAAKHGSTYRNIMIVPPEMVLREPPGQAVVCIAARAYAAMHEQLRKLGFTGDIVKLTEYDSYGEYSLSHDTIRRKQERVQRGMLWKKKVEKKYQGYFKILCPFSALGDVFFVMSYLKAFCRKRHIEKCLVCVVGDACKEVVSLFGTYETESFAQKTMDELIQACLYMKDENFFIAHQDRPYVVNLHKALYVKCIPLDIIYRCGVFGLPADTKREKPVWMEEYSHLDMIKRGKAVIFSPYAKSVTSLPEEMWMKIVRDYEEKGYQCFTNVSGEEEVLEGTKELRIQIAQMQSVAEWAGTFIGIRSGLCDVLTYANCKKIALYPDYNYCDTKWKAVQMYWLDGWENIVVGDNFQWDRL